MNAGQALIADPPLGPLNYLDADLYAGQGGPNELQTEFLCVVCTGVVLDPVECKECSSLYCKHCLKSMDMLCPKRCGGSEYTKVNRLVMNSLNKIPFRCQFQPACDKVVPYEGYQSHYRECPEGKPKPCENPDCQHKMTTLINRVNQLTEELEQLQHYKERNATIMKNQISDLK